MESALATSRERLDRQVGAGGQAFPTGRNGLLTVIVPVYNEARSIQMLVRRVQASPIPKEIIIVDDGSTDGTHALLEDCSADNLRVIHHHGNRGKGAAIRTGLAHARGEFVIIQDADLEYDPADYPAMLAPLISGDANAVYGVRDDHPSRSLKLFLGVRFLTILTNILYRCGIHDEATGYKAFRRGLLERIVLECERFEFCPEVTAKVCRLGEKIHEVPISYHPRSEGEGKKLRWTDGMDAILALIRYRFQRRSRFERRPSDRQATWFETEAAPTPELTAAADQAVV